MAKAAALRTLDLSRQVGAAIFTQNGEIISLGSNEVPTAEGGTYWSDERFDDRDYKRGYDSNHKRKVEILSEILVALGRDQDVETILQDKKIKESQFMDVLEYGRIVHAEMSALCDAARLGRAVADSVLYCTTFPCHMCAKHIVAAGVSKVMFLEPYPKSLAAALHADSLQIEGGDRGQYQTYPAIKFEHFYGITPRRYREIFEGATRKHAETGVFMRYKNDLPVPFIDIKLPLYQALETEVLKFLLDKVKYMEHEEFFESD